MASVTILAPIFGTMAPDVLRNGPTEGSLVITVVGEALLDLVASADGRCFTAHPGGSPANVAVGLARLGVPTRLATQLADDLAGRLVADHLRASRVTVESLPARSTATSLALAAVDDNGVASYDFRIAWDIARAPTLTPECRCLHTGSIASALTPGAEVLDDLLVAEHQRRVVTVSLDPNIRPSLIGPPELARQRVERQVALSDLVKVSAEDLRWLYPGQPSQQVAADWLRRGPALVVVTLGGDGAYAVSQTGEVTRPAIPVSVVDTVGAGDAFTAGLLDELLRSDLLGADRLARLAGLDSDTLATLLDFAIRVAGITCARPGADPPTRAELDQL